jgi:hypothetical protein
MQARGPSNKVGSEKGRWHKRFNHAIKDQVTKDQVREKQATRDWQ